jgi:hypothetical protein
LLTKEKTMWIVAIGWIYVVALMAATEPTVVAGIMTFFGYGVLPLSILFYLMGSKRRRARREIAATHAARQPAAPAATVDGYDAGGLLFATSLSNGEADGASCSDNGNGSDGSGSGDAGPDSSCGSGD